MTQFQIAVTTPNWFLYTLCTYMLIALPIQAYLAYLSYRKTKLEDKKILKTDMADGGNCQGTERCKCDNCIRLREM